MLAKLFKAFVGDKSASDIKEVQPVVDRVKEAEKSLENLSADDLRGRSTDLRERIRTHVESELTQINQLHAKATELPLSQLDQKEAIFEQIDALELQVNEGLEEVLEEEPRRVGVKLWETFTRLEGSTTLLYTRNREGWKRN